MSDAAGGVGVPCPDGRRHGVQLGRRPGDEAVDDVVDVEVTAVPELEEVGNHGGVEHLRVAGLLRLPGQLVEHSRQLGELDRLGDIAVHARGEGALLVA